MRVYIVNGDSEFDANMLGLYLFSSPCWLEAAAFDFCTFPPPPPAVRFVLASVNSLISTSSVSDGFNFVYIQFMVTRAVKGCNCFHVPTL